MAWTRRTVLKWANRAVAKMERDLGMPQPPRRRYPSEDAEVGSLLYRLDRIDLELKLRRLPPRDSLPGLE